MLLLLCSVDFLHCISVFQATSDSSLGQYSCTAAFLCRLRVKTNLTSVNHLTLEKGKNSYLSSDSDIAYSLGFLNRTK